MIIEYSDNLEAVCDMPALVGALHQAVLATGIAALDALRTRAEPRRLFVVADAVPSNAFVAMTARLAPGRPAQVRMTLLETLIETAEHCLGPAAQHVMLSAEYQEIDPEMRINKNNLRDVIAERGSA